MTSADVGYDFSSVGEGPDPSARIQLRGRAEMLSPACCSCCGNGTHHLPYVDPSIFFDYEGQIYFCQTCVTEMAQAIGCLDAEQSQFLIKLNDQLASENKELKAKLNEYNDLYERLSRTFGAGGSFSRSDSDDSKTDDQKAGNDGPINAVTFGRTEPSTKSVKSGPGRRPNDSSRASGGYPTGLNI